LVPNFQLSVNDVEVDYQALNRLEVDLSENQHDALSIHLAGIPMQAITDYQNAAVHLHFDTGAAYSFDFTGYVSDVRPESQTSQGTVNHSPFQNSVLVCLGASYEMRGARSRVWESATLATVVGEFAQRYGFSADVPTGDVLYNPIVQSQESDWQFLVRYAKLLGYAVNVHGTHIHIYDPHMAADRVTSFHRLVTVRATRGNVAPVPGQVADFRGSFSEHSHDGLYKNTIVTVDQDGGEFDVSTQEIQGIEGEARFENRINEHVNSYAQAVRVIDAASKQAYDYQATAIVSGVAGCVPGGIIFLTDYAAEFNGLWYVREVCHSISTGVFQSTLQLARNKTSELDTFQNTESFISPPLPRLMGTRWEATQRIVREYA
jgi:phage protein D